MSTNEDEVGLLSDAPLGEETKENTMDKNWPMTGPGMGNKPFDPKTLLTIDAGEKVDAKKLPLATRRALALKGPTLIFDGICNLCNGSMSWFQERVRNDSPVWYSE